MGDSLKTQRWLRAVVGSLALAAIVFHATAVVVRKGRRCWSPASDVRCAWRRRPGLHWKLPWPIDQASLLDMRRRVYETGHTEMLTRDKKNIIARTFVVWRIGDPLAFTQAIGTEGGAEAKLDGLLTNAAIGTLGGHDLSALVSTNPRDLQVDQIEAELLASTAPVGAAQLRRGDRADSARAHRAAGRKRHGGLRADARRAAAVRREVRGRRRAGSQPHPLGGGARGGAHPRQGRRGAGAHPRRVGGARSRRSTPTRTASTRSSTGSRARSSRSTSSSRGNTSLILRTDSEPFSLLQSKDRPVRRLGPPSEIGRLAAPVARVLDAAGSGCTGGSPRWWCSTPCRGSPIVKPDEVAVILRWGRLVGDTPALQEHGPGLLFAFPRPIDRVVRVPVKHVWEVPVEHARHGQTPTRTSSRPTRRSIR